MVRESESVAGSLALSLRVPTAFQSDGIAHYIILHTEDGYKIKVSSDPAPAKQVWRASNMVLRVLQRRNYCTEHSLEKLTNGTEDIANTLSVNKLVSHCSS
jgi:hypothetical protein